MRTQREVERKYEAAPDAQLPDLAGSAAEPRHETLDAVYYDTEDLRLIRGGLTLRRREGGADEGWHLKVPVGADTRDEIHLPLNGKDKPPKPFADLTLGYTRGAALQPVARITTERTVWELSGAELTDDRVTATRPDTEPMVWRELEVEGDPAVLDRAEEPLRQAGFQRSSLPSKLARALDTKPERHEPGKKAGETVLAYAAKQIEKIRYYDILVRQDVDDSVHQIRVATRRLRSALRVYRKVVTSGDLDAELQWLGKELSPARDLEVQSERLTKAVSELPVELAVGPVQAQLVRHFSPAQAQARKDVLRTLRSKRYLHLLDQLDSWLAAPPFTSKASRKAAKELPKHTSKAARKVGPRLDAGEVHRARKAAKRLRYGLEVLGSNKARKRAKAFTKLAGEYQDSVVALPLLRTLGMQENGFTFGLLYGREETNAARIRGTIRWG
ncbi:CYTH and CHAD domain-containing protein [Kibdelosporangium philippinense]|uniref:CYTH and CHAD domain-containing protein n=1 Tax=Kibdelosporangium philippinense TaxID=211113 RepID=A0ABS8ZLU9_9PSEU|nr:CYTH and CHAD domain-containing protein [Kibdelosporangium philippinense]MCE7008775.1 CYTH and CHAD domain-containing protein [Kibdelosporangium philippinense]